MKFLLYSVAIFLMACSVCLFGESQHQSPARIIFFFKPLITAENKPTITKEELYKFIETPGKMNRAYIKQMTSAQLINGIYVTYTGLVTHSDFNGEVIFPRHGTLDTLTLVVCNKVKPVILLGNTVNHFVTKADAPVAYYQFKRTKDKKLKQYVWEVTEQPTPANKRIPSNALVIIAKPKQIVIMKGKTITTKTPNLLLPDIYVTEKIRLSHNALQFLKINKFFAQTETAYYYENQRVTSLIIN